MLANNSLRKEISYTPLFESNNDEQTEHGSYEKVVRLPEPGRITGRSYTFTLRGLVVYFVTQAVAITVLVTIVVLSIRPSGQNHEIVLRRGEFAPARESIEAEQVLFVATTNFNKSREPPQTFQDDVPLYVGPPSEDIDNAWAKLLDDQYFYISDEEARDAWGSNYREYFREEGRGYRAGLDVFHTLHCLNILRKELYWEYYRGHKLQGYFAKLQAYHVDHCIDVIRQSLQCSSDLTPIPVRWYDNMTGKSAIDSERVHTCRNNAKIREWTTKQVQRNEV